MPGKRARPTPAAIPKGLPRLKTTTGASLSEVLNEKVTSGEENGFSRRRVVKGVAWTVPVIVTAIGVPPASASPGTTIPASFAWGASAQGSATGELGARSVQGPMEFTIQTGSAFTGTVVSYIVTIQADQTNQNAKLGIASSMPAGTPTTAKQGDKVTTFTGQLTTAPGNHALTVKLTGFTYSSPNRTGAHTYTASVTVDGAPQTQTSTLNITY